MVDEYRYELKRNRGERTSLSGGLVCWVMLNPSTADESRDDATIRRVKRFSWDRLFDELVVVNLFALRSTDPEKLFEAKNPIGQKNDLYIRKWAERCEKIVVAWGSLDASSLLRRHVLRQRADDVWKILSEFDPRYGITCLGTTEKSGEPRHPLYVRANAEIVSYAR